MKKKKKIDDMDQYITGNDFDRRNYCVSILYTAYISFTNMNLFHWNDYKFVGIENYVRALFKVDAGFLSAILTTILWTILNMVIQVSGCVFLLPWD